MTRGTTPSSRRSVTHAKRNVWIGWVLAFVVLVAWFTIVNRFLRNNMVVLLLTRYMYWLGIILVYRCGWFRFLVVANGINDNNTDDPAAATSSSTSQEQGVATIGETTGGGALAEEGPVALVPGQNTTSEAVYTPLSMDEEATRSNTLSSTNSAVTPPPRRLYFLDNLKVFLTIVVVTGHSADPLWDLPTIPPSAVILELLDWVNQGYIMCLFFFVSAYFIPASYDRGKTAQAFFQSKTKRLLWPATITGFTIVPMSSWGVQLFVNHRIDEYFPSFGHCWYILWLLVMAWAYSTIREAGSLHSYSLPNENNERSDSIAVDDVEHEQAIRSNNREAEEEDQEENDGVMRVASNGSPEPQSMPFPGLFQRYVLAGAIGCGLCMMAVIFALGGGFFVMPIAIGSVTCDIVLFMAGIAAGHYGWLSRPLDRTQLGMPVWLLRTLVVVEMGLVIVLAFVFEDVPWWVSALLFAVAGIYCIDVSLAILQVFQQYFDYCNPFTLFLSQGAYLVYLIHPMVLDNLLVLFAVIYNRVYPGAIVVVDGDLDPSSALRAKWHFWAAYLFVVILGHAICWPVGYCLQGFLLRKGLL